uniref:Uncharacterized protein n=1 Tax=Alexandrium monilatum TaxID=311494 RepID=A0A7S4W179_9DINO
MSSSAESQAEQGPPAVSGVGQLVTLPLWSPRSPLGRSRSLSSALPSARSVGSSSVGMRRLSVYDQDIDDSLKPIEQEQAPAAMAFQEGASCVVKPYRTNFLGKLLIIVSTVLGPLYLAYILRHGRADMPVFAAVFFLGEAVTLLLNVGNRFVLWHRQRRHVCRLDSLNPPFPCVQWPKVHICFTHYMEPVSESVKPLKRALRQQYPPDLLVVSILDDGYHKRKDDAYETTDLGREMEEMILKTLARLTPHGCGTVSKARRVVLPGDRPRGRSEVAPAGSTVVEFQAEGLPLVRLVGRMKGRESHLKTGNLENALWNVMEEDARFMVILDTDMAPERDMLQLLLPPMLEFRAGRWRPDWRTGFVVSPQACTNVETVFGTDDPMNQANKYNWRVAPPALDTYGFVHFWGTNTAFFVPALKQANGFMYGCIGEDTVTGAAIHRFGWRSTFVGATGVTLARGLCRTSVAETFDQRKRWVQGNVQQFLKDFDPPCILHEGFRNPPYHRQYLQEFSGLRALDRRGEPPAPLAADDCGVAARQSRRTLWWSLQRELAYFGPKYAAFFNVIPMYYYGVAMAIVLTGQVPFAVLAGPIRTPWDLIDSFYIIVMHWVASALVSVVLHSYVLGDANNPSNTLWRTQQEFWGYAWARTVGVFEGLLSAVTGKQPKWKAFGMAGGVNLVLEVPNVLAFLAMAGAMAAVLLNYYSVAVGVAAGLPWLPGPATMPAMQLVASMVVGFWVLFLLWPVTSCIFADFLGIPYYRLGAIANTLIAGVAQVGFAAIWTLTAVC